VNSPPDHLGEERSPIAPAVLSPVQLQSDATTPAVGSDQLPTEPNSDARQKRLRSKAAYRARRADDDAFREAERRRAREWRRNRPEKAKAQKRKARSENYNRPIVAIDSEGQNYLGADITYDGVRYLRHDTYLWGAATDDGRAPSWLIAPETTGLDKRPLHAFQMLDWLLSLPDQFGPAVFVMFSFGYDITQILKHLPYEKAWEIEKRETYGKIVGDQHGARTIKPVTKIRGGDARKYGAKLKANQWLIENVLAAWQTAFDPHKPEQFPRIVAPYQKYITAGNAMASRHRWKLAGRWTARPGDPGAGTREINVHNVGNKRELVPDEVCWPDYVSVPGHEARRCNGLIRTLPALNNDRALSRPRMPEWLDERIGEKLQDQEEQEELRAGFE
jgi:hypothetical protein